MRLNVKSRSCGYYSLANVVMSREALMTQSHTSRGTITYDSRIVWTRPKDQRMKQMVKVSTPAESNSYLTSICFYQTKLSHSRNQLTYTIKKLPNKCSNMKAYDPRERKASAERAKSRPQRNIVSLQNPGRHSVGFLS